LLIVIDVHELTEVIFQVQDGVEELIEALLFLELLVEVLDCEFLGALVRVRHLLESDVALEKDLAELGEGKVGRDHEDWVRAVVLEGTVRDDPGVMDLLGQLVVFQACQGAHRGCLLLHLRLGHCL